LSLDYIKAGLHFPQEQDLKELLCGELTIALKSGPMKRRPGIQCQETEFV